MTELVPVSPLSLNQLTRDYWGQFDGTAIAQLAALANDPCYTIKFYKAPGDDQEVFSNFGYVDYGMRVTPGSLIFGYYLPCIVDTDNPTLSVPAPFTLQVRDVDLQHDFSDIPVSSLLVSNFKPTYQSNVTLAMGSFPHLLSVPHPVTGSGQYKIQIQETVSDTLRIQVVVGVIEVCSAS